VRRSDKYLRLNAIKAKYDPDKLLRLNRRGRDGLLVPTTEISDRRALRWL